MVNFGNSWDKVMEGEFDKPYYLELRQFLINEYRTRTIYPNMYQIYNAFTQVMKENNIDSLDYVDKEEFFDMIYDKRYEMDNLRRYQKGILVLDDKGLTSYAQIVASKMKQYGYEKMSESQFFSFLAVNNLARKAIPNELSNNDYIRKEGDTYCVIQ